MYFRDTGSSESFTTVTYQKSSAAQMCLNMELSYVDGCMGRGFETFSTEASVHSSPHVQGLQDHTVLAVNVETQSLQACLSESLMQSMPQNEPINLIFTVYWTDNSVE